VTNFRHYFKKKFLGKEYSVTNSLFWFGVGGGESPKKEELFIKKLSLSCGYNMRVVAITRFSTFIF
jgi:hypothetical protein